MEPFTLSGGRQIEIRPIRPDDADRLKAAYLALSPKSKYQRFLAPKPHLTEVDTRYLVDVDGVNHVALVATTTDNPDWIVAVARFVRLPEDPRVAEFAIVVGDPYQGKGLGTALLERLREEARKRGVHRFRATTLAENAPVHRLLRRVPGGLAQERHLGSVDELEIDLAA